MFRLWGKIWKDNHLLKELTICDSAPQKEKNRTKKVFDAVEEICYTFDIGKPIWLDVNISEFQRINRTRFTSDSFVEEINFDYLEIHVIEEDEIWE